jgi:hypothetical protein
MKLLKPNDLENLINHEKTKDCCYCVHTPTERTRIFKGLFTYMKQRQCDGWSDSERKTFQQLMVETIGSTYRSSEKDKEYAKVARVHKNIYLNWEAGLFEKRI